MQQIYVLIGVLAILLGFGALMHQTQYQTVRENGVQDLSIAKRLDKLDPAAGMGYKADSEIYVQALGDFNGKRIYLNQ